MKTTLIALISATLTAAALAAPQSFDFKDPKGVNNAVFKLDAPLESINGTASGVSGTVTYDPDKPENLTGKIVIEAKSLTVPNPMMQQHMHGDQWMDVEKYPEITFEAVKVANATKSGDKVTAEIIGNMTLHGVTKELTVPVSFTYLKDKLKARSNTEGDLLVVRSTFTIQRADFGINPGAPADKVAEEIELTLSLAGAAPKS